MTTFKFTETEILAGVRRARRWITRIGAEFPGVDRKRVLRLYARALVTGRARLDPADVRAIYRKVNQGKRRKP